jgi:hypothetical protein
MLFFKLGCFLLASAQKRSLSTQKDPVSRRDTPEHIQPFHHLSDVIYCRKGLGLAKEDAECRTRRPVANVARGRRRRKVPILYLQRHIEVDLFTPEVDPGFLWQNLPESLTD